MKDVLLTLLHLAVITAKLSGPGGVRAVMAENLVLKQQLIVLRRGRRRAPRLTLTDRLLCGFGALVLSPGRIRKVAIALRPSTLLAFHQALVRGKYRRLFSSAPCLTKPEPKGPDKALIQAIVELKSRNPRFGCPRIARIISRTFGVDVDKNVVHRVLAKHYRPTSGKRALMVVIHRTHHGQPLERRPLSMRVHRAPELLGARRDGPIHASPRRSRRALRSGQRR
jgi:putative transposase